MNRPPRRLQGLALLEFALGMAVAGVLITLALGALSHLQLLGDEARRVTIANNQAAASSTQMLRCELRPGRRAPPADCFPCPAPAASTSRTCP
jgi:hypothetical protein